MAHSKRLAGFLAALTGTSVGLLGITACGSGEALPAGSPVDGEGACTLQVTYAGRWYESVHLARPFAMTHSVGFAVQPPCNDSRDPETVYSRMGQDIPVERVPGMDPALVLVVSPEYFPAQALISRSEGRATKASRTCG